MNNKLQPMRQLHQAVCIRVAKKKHDLEEQHAGRPHRRTPAEPGEDGLADYRLDLEEEKRTSKNGEGKGGHAEREAGENKTQGEIVNGGYA